MQEFVQYKQVWSLKKNIYNSKSIGEYNIPENKYSEKMSHGL